jgi:Protein of unknown function (DUF4031)
MVDEITVWPHARPPFHRGSCHLTVTGGDIDALHAFAHRLGMKRSWFQDHPRAPHYDLTPTRRRNAIEYGAVFVSAKDQARKRLGT